MFTFERPCTDEPDIPLVLCWIFLYSTVPVLVLDLAIRRLSKTKNHQSPTARWQPFCRRWDSVTLLDKEIHDALLDARKRATLGRPRGLRRAHIRNFPNPPQM